MARHRLTITVTEAAELLGISRGLAYEMVRTGKLTALRFGKRLLIPKIAIEQLLQSTISEEFLFHDTECKNDQAE